MIEDACARGAYVYVIKTLAHLKVLLESPNLQLEEPTLQ